jgi:hypothetical protein
MAELLVPEMALTQQLLSVHSVVVDEDEMPLAVHVDFVSENQADVFFKVVSEDHFVVVALDTANENEPVHAWIQNGHRFEFCVTSQDHSFEELKSKTTLRNFTGWSKGDIRPADSWCKDGMKIRVNEKTRTFSFLSYLPTQNSWDDFEESLAQMLSDLEQDVTGVIELGKIANTRIKIVRSQALMANAGYSVSARTIFRLNRLGLSCKRL